MTTPPKIPTDAMAPTDEPDFIEGLQGFATMCDSGVIDKHDGPMLARKFRDAAFVISTLQKLRDELRAAPAVAPKDDGLADDAAIGRAAQVLLKQTNGIDADNAYEIARQMLAVAPRDEVVDFHERHQLQEMAERDAFNVGLEDVAAWHEAQAEKFSGNPRAALVVAEHRDYATAIRARRRPSK